MASSVPLHPNYKAFYTDAERDLENRWSRGIDWVVEEVKSGQYCVVGVGAVFSNKKDAHDYVSWLVCDVFPGIATKRAEKAEGKESA